MAIILPTGPSVTWPLPLSDLSPTILPHPLLPVHLLAKLSLTHITQVVPVTRPLYVLVMPKMLTFPKEAFTQSLFSDTALFFCIAVVETGH